MQPSPLSKAHLLQEMQEAQHRPQKAACQHFQPCTSTHIILNAVTHAEAHVKARAAHRHNECLWVCTAEGCHLHLMEFSWAMICSSVGLELASGAGKASRGVDVTISVVFCSSQLSPGAAETLFTEVWRVFSARLTFADGTSTCSCGLLSASSVKLSGS